MHAALTGERDGYYAPFGSMAAIADALTGPKDDLPRSRFVVCTQNHDQVGNRAKGERLVDLTGIDGPDRDRARAVRSVHADAVHG